MTTTTHRTHRTRRPERRLLNLLGIRHRTRPAPADKPTEVIAHLQAWATEHRRVTRLLATLTATASIAAGADPAAGITPSTNGPTTHHTAPAPYLPGHGPGTYGNGLGVLTTP